MDVNLFDLQLRICSYILPNGETLGKYFTEMSNVNTGEPVPGTPFSVKGWEAVGVSFIPKFCIAKVLLYATPYYDNAYYLYTYRAKIIYSDRSFPSIWLDSVVVPPGDVSFDLLVIKTLKRIGEDCLF